MENNYYNESLLYQQFLEQQDFLNLQVIKHVNECRIISEEVDFVRKLSAFNEGFIDVLKAFFEKFKTMFANIWKKFMSNVDALVLKDEKYLEKYKDVILNKKNPDIPIQLFDYDKGFENMKSYSVPNYDSNKMQTLAKNIVEKDISDIKKEVIVTYFPQLSSKISRGGDWVDFLKSIFRGGESLENCKKIETNLKDMDMQAKFKLCSDYKEIVNTYTGKDKDTMLKNADVAERFIEQHNDEIVDKVDNNKDKGEEQTGGDNGGGNNNDNKAQQEPVNLGPTPKNQQGEQEGTTKNVNTSAMIYFKEADGDNQDNKEGESSKKMTTTVQKINIEFATISRELVTCKMTIIEEIEKTYMSMIKLKVKHYVGNDTVDDKKGDQSKDNQDKGQEGNK